MAADILANELRDLADESACDIMGEPALRLIAHELMTNIKQNVSVD
jgi:hypothetical protein